MRGMLHGDLYAEWEQLDSRIYYACHGVWGTHLIGPLLFVAKLNFDKNFCGVMNLMRTRPYL